MKSSAGLGKNNRTVSCTLMGVSRRNLVKSRPRRGESVFFRTARHGPRQGEIITKISQKRAKVSQDTPQVPQHRPKKTRYGPTQAQDGPRQAHEGPKTRQIQVQVSEDTPQVTQDRPKEARGGP